MNLIDKQKKVLQGKIIVKRELNNKVDYLGYDYMGGYCFEENTSFSLACFETTQEASRAIDTIKGIGFVGQFFEAVI